jgi:hypothetical protein
MSILGMHPCEGTEAVPPHARSHTVLLSGQFPGDERALVRWVKPLTSFILADGVQNRKKTEKKHFLRWNAFNMSSFSV